MNRQSSIKFPFCFILREWNDGDYETEAGDNQIADVSNSYMAVEGKV